MVPDLLHVFSEEGQRLLIVRIDLAQLVPVKLDLLASCVNLLPKFVEYVLIWHYCRQVSPELHLEVTDSLYAFLHLAEEALEFDDICEFRVNIFVFGVVLLDIVFYDVLVPEDSKLLLQVWLLFDSCI